MKQSMILKKLRTKEVSILEYCIADSDGKIRNQDAQVQKCFNENIYITLDGCEILIDNFVQLRNRSRVRNGFISKGSDGAYLEITQNCTLENIFFTQPDFNTSHPLLAIKEAGNIKIDKCVFHNSTIYFNPWTTHYHVTITNCNLDSDNTRHVDRGEGELYTQTQNNAIHAHLEGNTKIVNLTIDNCKFGTARCALVARSVKSLHFTNNIFRGNESVSSNDNALNVLNLYDINSLQVVNNTVKEYITSGALFVMSYCRGDICNNIIKDNTAESAMYIDACDDLNILGNQITKSIAKFTVSNGIIAKGGNSYNISNNKISEVGIKAISLSENNYHSIVSNNILTFNNKFDHQWAGTLSIYHCYCITCIGNYVHLEEAHSAGSKPGFTFADNNFGLVSNNYIRGYVDMARNNDVDMYNNKWL